MSHDQIVRVERSARTNLKKLCIVVPLIRDAATPLEASFVTTKLLFQIGYHCTHYI